MQNLCATTAFWLLFRGSVRDVDRRPALAHPLALVVMLASFTVPFLCIQDRGVTVFTFIVDEIDQTATWLYASVYMVCVAAITVTTVARGVLGSRGALVVFRIGLSLVAIASVEEIVSLTADHFVLGSALLRDVLRTAFDPPFYLGIVLMVAAMASMTVRRWGREARLRGHRVRLARIAARHDLHARRRRGGLQVRTYDLLIAIRDAEVQGREPHPRGDRARAFRRASCCRRTSKADGGHTVDGGPTTAGCAQPGVVIRSALRRSVLRGPGVADRGRVPPAVASAPRPT